MTHRGYSEADDDTGYLDRTYVTLADARLRARAAFWRGAVVFGALGLAAGWMWGAV